ncbi:MAG: 7,8-didemethyl-8-hydroxy-5-deazariboflavin synthase subunit CofG [Candidatus Odinarchaeota archaeon]
MSDVLINRYLATGQITLDENLLDAASRLRNQHVGKTITYSKNIFVPLTYYCRNDCSYCNFKRESGDPFFPPDELQKLLELALKTSSIEVLFTHGEKPEEKYPVVKEFLEREGLETTVELLMRYCKQSLEKGLLPHSNPGITSREEMKALKRVNASQGLMLENISDRLALPGMPHHLSPGKVPKARTTVLKNAGELDIPFTTGLLIGIGETTSEVIESLYRLGDLQERYGHIQEVIIQPCKACKTGTGVTLDEKPQAYLFNTIAIARLILDDVPIQAPPNLSSSPDEWTLLLKAGISDFGGISSLTVDHVNPSSPWPSLSTLAHHVKQRGFKLIQRLPVYPRFITGNWLDEEVLKIINRYEMADGQGFFNVRNVLTTSKSSSINN